MLSVHYYSANTKLKQISDQQLISKIKISKKYRGLRLFLRIMYFKFWYSRFIFEISETSDFYDLRKYMYAQQFHFLKSCANLSWLARIELNEILSCAIQESWKAVEIECAYYVVWWNHFRFIAERRSRDGLQRSCLECYNGQSDRRSYLFANIWS